MTQSHYRRLSPPDLLPGAIRTALLVLLVLTLGHRSIAGVRISEILTENDGGLRDADGDTPDWIELLNDGVAPVNLAGWHLTDTPTNLAKWTFPATNLAPGGLLVVFASNKDRAIPGAELHTNFRLDSAGGYVALVQSDGASIAHTIDYPSQRRNVSFGRARQTVNTPLLSSGALVRLLVPGDAALGLSWTERVFNDASWIASNAPVGFGVGPNVVPILSIDFNERGVAASTYTQPGFSSFVVNSNPTAAAIQTLPATRAFGSLSVTVSNSALPGYDDRVRTTPVNSGALTEALLLQDFIFSTDATGTSGLDVSISGLAPNKLHRLTVWSFDSGSPGSRVSDWFANGILVTNGYRFDGTALPADNERYRFSFDAASDGAGTIVVSGRRNLATANTYGVFLNALQVSTITTVPGNTGLASLMLGSNASVFLRIPFNVSNPDAITALTLQTRYDDGFVAYLNGQLVASRNAPGSPTWNSSATASHSGAVAEDIPIVPPPGLLLSGENLLAIHGLNVSADDPDFAIAPELFAQQITELGDRYFQPPTPGTNNSAGFVGLVADPKFSANRGFYDAAFSLSITCATAGAEIRFTTNGSPPSATAGYIFSTPINITGHSFIRAAAFKTGFVPSDIDTHSYLFLRDVLRQSNNIPNYPTLWQASYPADYAMDSNLVSHPVYGPALSNALRSIRTLSIVADHNGLWNSSTGIYPNSTSSGTAWERAASMELIDGSGGTEFAVNCKLEMHGNASRDNVRTPKHSMHTVFNGDYGPTKLRYDWFGGGVDVHNKIILRSCGFVDGWAGRYADSGTYTSAETGESFRGLRYRPENTCYLRDAWVKDSFREMGWISSRSQYVHLYINGLYWGLYEPSEAPGATYFAEHLGGEEGAWDVLVGEDNGGPPVIVDGSGADWTNVLNLVNATIATEAAYAAITNLVDIDNLIDYMMVHIVAESEDWPHHNWYLAHRRATNGVTGTRFICTVWDQELTLDRLVRRNRINVGGTGGEIYSPARVYQQLRNWPEFRRQFGDRVHKHLFNSGALTPGNNVARLLGPAALIRDAVIGESARWGDARKTGVPAGQVGTGQTFTRNEWWQPEVDKLATNFFQKLTADNVARFRAGGLYPAIGAPAFGQFGGNITNGFSLVVTQTNAAGIIYLTVDGSDPRTYGTGAVAPPAQAYSSPISFNAPTLVRARVLSGGQWSALVEAIFYPPQDFSKLAVTEIMFNPSPSGLIDGDEFEFLELKNTGTNTLNLGGLHSTGITAFFPLDATLAPGAFWVIARNATQFASRYPGVTINSIYSGRLANEGEVFSLLLPGAGKLLSVDYRDTPPWPAAADGHGFSLVPRASNPIGASDNGQDWRASTNPGGSPGADDPTPTIPTVLINEVIANPIPLDLDAVELFNPNALPVNIGGWFLTDDSTTPTKYRITDGTMISAGGFLTFTENHFNPTPGTNNSFALGAKGDQVFLFSGSPQTNLTGYSHGLAFDASPPGISLGRHLNSANEEDLVAQIASTFNGPNAGPAIGPVVINEIQYHPDASGDEFVELANLTAGPVQLFDPAVPTNTWRLNGLGFSFPTNVTLPPNGMILIVATNPTIFRTKYQVPAAVQLFERQDGALQDSGERLQLQRPGVPDTNGVPYYTVDMVRYNDRAPWPPAADGSGPSLQRINPSAYGNEPLNWVAAGPTPGQPRSTADTDGDGLPDQWEEDNDTNPFLADADEDPDADGMSNFEEFLAGTHPQSAGSQLRLDYFPTAPGTTTFRFLAVAGRTYSVLYKNSLAAPIWSKLKDIEAGIDRVITVEDTNPLVSSRFYRLVTPRTE